MIPYLNVQRRLKFQGAAPPDAQSFDITLRTGTAWMPLVLVQADQAFNITLYGGDRVSIATAVAPEAALPIAVEWKLHGGVVAGCGTPSFDDLEVAATATSLKGATMALAAERSGTLFTVEGGLFNAYLLRGRLLSLPPGLMDVTVTMTVLRAPSSGGGVTVQVGGMAG